MRTAAPKEIGAQGGPAFGRRGGRGFLHACKEAQRLGLELSLNIQSGWNLGGPSVTAAETTQQLAWSKTRVDGPAALKQTLPRPEVKDGFYREIAVIAVSRSPPGLHPAPPLKDLALKNATGALGMSTARTPGSCWKPILSNRASWI